MESQPQNPEFRINPENFHPCIYNLAKFFNSTIRVSSSLHLDQAHHFVSPDLGPNCLQRLAADSTSR